MILVHVACYSQSKNRFTYLNVPSLKYSYSFFFSVIKSIFTKWNNCLRIHSITIYYRYIWSLLAVKLTILFIVNVYLLMNNFYGAIQQRLQNDKFTSEWKTDEIWISLSIISPCYYIILKSMHKRSKYLKANFYRHVLY